MKIRLGEKIMGIEERIKSDVESILNKYGFNIDDFSIETNTGSPAPNRIVKVEYIFSRKSNSVSRTYGGKWADEFEKDLKAQVFGFP